jgi:uncharacterized membrane protein YvbJ
MYCPSCGEEIADDSSFCRHCGTGFGPEDEPEEEEVIGDTPPDKPESEGSETSALKKIGYWGGRIVQAILTLLAVIFLIGGLSMNVIQFAAIGIFALVLLGFAGIIEVVIVRPSAK